MTHVNRINLYNLQHKCKDKLFFSSKQYILIPIKCTKCKNIYIIYPAELYLQIFHVFGYLNTNIFLNKC